MAEDDIYHSKRHYGKFLRDLDELHKIPEKKAERGNTRKYYCKNPANVRYFRQMHKLFESRDTSYVRRLRLFRNMLVMAHVAKKDFATCEVEDINELVTFNHTINKSPKSKSDFIREIKFIWKCLFPEKDERGRVDETLVPYVVRHLSTRIDRSKQVLRNDRINLQEYKKIIGFFSSNKQMQCYIALATESLGRPQEICYTKIKDVEIQENYAKVWISSHGKEGTKFLQCIDAFPYLMKWYDAHPYKSDPDAFLFIANGNKDQQLTPALINKKLRFACKKLDIQKSVTAYSLKRNGVTFARLQGDSDVDIQHRAGWTSTKQLKTYDMSTADDVMKRQLAKRGLMQNDNYSDFVPKRKECLCGTQVGFADKICYNCKRMLDKKQIKKDMEAEKEIRQVFSFALRNPDMKFLDIMDKFRKS